MLCISVAPWRTNYEILKDPDIAFVFTLKNYVISNLPNQNNKEDVELITAMLKTQNSIELLSLFKKNPREFYLILKELIQMKIFSECIHLIKPDHHQLMMEGVRSVTT